MKPWQALQGYFRNKPLARNNLNVTFHHSEQPVKSFWFHLQMNLNGFYCSHTKRDKTQTLSSSAMHAQFWVEGICAGNHQEIKWKVWHWWPPKTPPLAVPLCLWRKLCEFGRLLSWKVFTKHLSWKVHFSSLVLHTKNVIVLL